MILVKLEGTDVVKDIKRYMKIYDSSEIRNYFVKLSKNSGRLEAYPNAANQAITAGIDLLGQYFVAVPDAGNAGGIAQVNPPMNDLMNSYNNMVCALVLMKII